jgi:hypothetical protein
MRLSIVREKPLVLRVAQIESGDKSLHSKDRAIRHFAALSSWIRKLRKRTSNGFSLLT